MTRCTGTPADTCLEGYIQGTLPEFEARKFEEHYFDCPVCLAQVQAFQAAAMQLGAKPVEVPKIEVPKKPITWPVRAAGLGAIAATLLVGYVGVRTMRQSTQHPMAAAVPGAAEPQPVAVQAPAAKAATLTVARLADFTLPVFRMSNLRGESRNAEFDEGMKAYTRKDCANAVKNLGQVPAQDADRLAAQFYMGICQLQERELDAASGTLRAVAEAGDSPQQEAALYYLAQLALAREDATVARDYLKQTIALRGDFEEQARAELKQLR